MTLLYVCLCAYVYLGAYEPPDGYMVRERERERERDGGEGGSGYSY